MEFDSIPGKGREATQIRIECDKWFVARRDRRLQESVKLFLALGLSHSFANRVIHGALHRSTALRQLWAAYEEEYDDPHNRYDVQEQ